jgi:hypothetical protein
MNLETIEWSLYPSRRDASSAAGSNSVALDMAGYRRRRKSMNHSALDDLVSATLSESRAITELYVNPLVLGVDALRFVSHLLKQRGHEGSTLRELVLHCPLDLSETHPVMNAGDNGSALASLDRANIDKVLRAAAFQSCGDGAGLSHLRSFHSNVLPADPTVLREFLQSEPGLEELRLGAHQSGFEWVGESPQRRPAETIGHDDASAILHGLASVAALRSVTLRSLKGDGLARLVAGLGSVPSVELELDFTADLMSAVRELVATATGLEDLALRNSGSREVDCGPLLASLRQSASIRTLTLSRFAVSRCEPRESSKGGARNSSLEDMSLIDCVIDSGAMALPVRGLCRLSLQGCRLASDVVARKSLLIQGSEAMVRRMVLHAAMSSFRVWGCRTVAEEVFCCRDVTTAQQLRDLALENPSLTKVEFLGIWKEFADHIEMFEYALQLNQAGGARDVVRDVPLNLIPTLWARYTTRAAKHNPSVLHQFVKRLAPVALAASHAPLPPRTLDLTLC